MPELRKKMLYTLFIILIFRFGSCIPVPFIDTQMLAQYFEQASTNGSMLGYLDMFSGGGLSRATIFAMSITPYINASIILQLLTVAIPALERMVKDGGEEGRDQQRDRNQQKSAEFDFVGFIHDSISFPRIQFLCCLTAVVLFRTVLFKTVL